SARRSRWAEAPAVRSPAVGRTALFASSESFRARARAAAAYLLASEDEPLDEVADSSIGSSVTVVLGDEDGGSDAGCVLGWVEGVPLPATTVVRFSTDESATLGAVVGCVAGVTDATESIFSAVAVAAAVAAGFVVGSVVAGVLAATSTCAGAK